MFGPPSAAAGCVVAILESTDVLSALRYSQALPSMTVAALLLLAALGAVAAAVDKCYWAGPRAECGGWLQQAVGWPVGLAAACKRPQAALCLRPQLGSQQGPPHFSHPALRASPGRAHVWRAHTAHPPLLRRPGPGYPGITQDICEERGCCWVPVDFHDGPSADLPWCAGGQGGGGSTPSCWHLGQGLPSPSRPLARSALMRM